MTRIGGGVMMAPVGGAAVCGRCIRTAFDPIEVESVARNSGGGSFRRVYWGGTWKSAGSGSARTMWLNWKLISPSVLR